jgi:proteic killer suppression protein
MDMRLVGFRHKDLERLWRRGETRGMARKYEAKLRAMLTALEEAENVAELGSVPGWRLHPLKGARRSYWSLFVTANYRLTFRIEGSTISDIDLEDYH